MLPSKIKAEVKLTTGTGVSLAARELEALAVTDAGAVGLVAVLFVGGDRELDGRWTIVDAAGFFGRNGESVSSARSALVATARTQSWLDPLRRHVDALWPAFLHAFVESAEQGHAGLVAELETLHAERRLRERVPRDRVLGVEHLANVKELVRRHGESDAGRLAQDLLAYLLALVGYSKVTLNAVGVPDFVLEGCTVGDPVKHVMISLVRTDAERVVALCRAAGDERLALAVESKIR